MKIISINNLKGGVGKTTTAVNLAYNLTELGYKVLLIDNDKQGNLSSFYNRYDESKYGTHTLLANTTENIINECNIIQNTDYENLDIITTNMLLLIADKQVMTDDSNPQQTKYKNGLKPISDNYDYCIIDNSPSLDISVINALACADEVIIPIKIDDYCTLGFEMLKPLEIVKKNFNDNLKNVFILFTMQTNSKVNASGTEEIRKIISKINSSINYKILDTSIRRTIKADESTYKKKPLSLSSKNATITKDYEALAIELTK